MTVLSPSLQILKTIQKLPINGWYYQRFKSTEPFQFHGREYAYFYHRSNRTWMNERAVEVPLAWEFVNQSPGPEILEVGNVLSRYYSIAHDVVDKYEQAPHVVNSDVVEFVPAKAYDTIVSISTLEHVGWDETPREPDKCLRAVEHLQSLLAPGGSLLVTVPLGYNPYLDHLLETGELKFDQQLYLKRVSHDNRWRQVEWSEVRGAAYNEPFLSANGLVVGRSGGVES